MSVDRAELDRRVMHRVGNALILKSWKTLSSENISSRLERWHRFLEKFGADGECADLGSEAKLEGRVRWWIAKAEGEDEEGFVPDALELCDALIGVLGGFVAITLAGTWDSGKRGAVELDWLEGERVWCYIYPGDDGGADSHALLDPDDEAVYMDGVYDALMKSYYDIRRSTSA